MNTVLVTGGTGHLGKAVVDLLMAGGHEVRVLARSPGSDPRISWVQGDLATGAGVAAAVENTDVVLNAATWSPAARRGYIAPVDLVKSPPDVDVDGTRRLLAEAGRAEVAHFVQISIVGLERMHLPYARVKLAAEELVRAGPVPWSIVSATAFHWLWHRTFTKQMRLPAWILPGLLVQPVDSDDFAAYVVQCLTHGPGGDREDFAGPETLSLVDLGRQFLQVVGQRRPILPLPVPSKFEQAAGGLADPDARHGTTTWTQWLQRHQGEVGAHG